VKCRLAVIAATVLTLSGCERAMHDMYEQPKYKPLTPTTQFGDGNSSRPQVNGTIVRSSGAAAASSSGREGLVQLERDPGQATPIDAQGRSLAEPGDSVLAS
jgi:hypothetical protein